MTRRKPAINGTIELSARLSRCGSLIAVRMVTERDDSYVELDREQTHRLASTLNTMAAQLLEVM